MASSIVAQCVSAGAWLNGSQIVTDIRPIARPSWPWFSLPCEVRCSTIASMADVTDYHEGHKEHEGLISTFFCIA